MCILQAEGPRLQPFRGLPATGTFITSWGSTGIGDSDFISPGGLTVDSANKVYVGDYGENYRIQKFDSNGKFITKWGIPVMVTDNSGIQLALWPTLQTTYT